MSSLWTRVCISLPSILTIVLLCGSWIAVSEVVQGLQCGWNKPWFICYAVHATYSIALVPWYILRYRRTGLLNCCRSSSPGGGSDSLSPTLPSYPSFFPISLKQALSVCICLQVVSCFASYSWYLSVENTLASANNAVYQSSGAFVLIFSYFLVGEVITLSKLLAVILCILGVVVVSLAPASALGGGGCDGEPAPPTTQTAGGYLWCIGSVVAYALYEVLYGRYTELKLESWRDVWRTDFISSHALEAASATGPAATSSTAATAGVLPPAASFAASSPSPPGGSDEGDRQQDDSEGGSLQSLLPLKGGQISPAHRNDSNDAPPPTSPHSERQRSCSRALEKAEMSSFMLGMMGLFSALTLWPLFFIFDATGVETFMLPPSSDKVRLLLAMTAIDTTFAIALLFGIQVASPLWISVGTVLVVPGSILADWLLHSATVSLQAAVGICVILIGFALLNFMPRRWDEACKKICVDRCCCGRSTGSSGRQ